MDELILRRRNKIILRTYDENNDNSLLVASIHKLVESLGYTFNKEVFQQLAHCQEEELVDLYKFLEYCLCNYVGADVDYEPMYPNFPESVMDKSEFQLYFNALIHYWSSGLLFPREQEEQREYYEEKQKQTVLSIGVKEECVEIIRNLLLSKTPISYQDINDIAHFFQTQDIEGVLPEVIPLKQNCALVGKIYLEVYPEANMEDIKKYFKTATDVLRLAVMISDGDVNLTINTRFISFPNRQRKILLQLLENCNNIEEDMKRYKNVWLRLGERLHPKKYKNFPKVNIAFQKLRNNEAIPTWQGLLNTSIQEHNVEQTIKLLVQRPGDFSRSLDYVVRNFENKEEIIKAFKSIAHNVSSTVLLQVWNHFENRGRKRGILLGTEVYIINKEVAEIERDYCLMIVDICKDALIQQYKQKEYLGKVYLSPEYKKYVVPFALKDANKALKTLVTGSKIKLELNTNILRSFIWWTNTNNHIVDVDLSVTILDEKYDYVEHISYSNLKSTKLNCCHSGDIVDGGDVDGPGVAEFLDMDIDKIVENNGRYAVVGVYNFSRITFSYLPNMKFGWMEREVAMSGEIFEPGSVKQRIDLSSDNIVSIPVIIDCLTREMMWLDLSVDIDSLANVEDTYFSGRKTCQYMMEHIRNNLHELISLHIQARGVQVDNKEDADIIFDIEEGITPYDIDIFVGQYL